MYDIHCHIIPGIDDGSDNFRESLNMLSVASEGRTRGIITTPHSFRVDRAADGHDLHLKNAFEDFCKAVRECGIETELYPGEEIFYGKHTLERLESGSLITLNHSRYPLVEFDMDSSLSSVVSAVKELIAAGYVPIVAHPERYGFSAVEPTAAFALKDAGALLQVNSTSVEGVFGRAAAHCAKVLLFSRAADFVASDAHSPFVRWPRLCDVHEFVSEEISPHYAEKIFRQNPLKVIENKTIKI